MRKILLTLSLLLPLIAVADDPYNRRLIHTNGYGEIKVKPDIATVYLTVRANRKEALAAKTEVDERFNKFLAALKKLKIKQEDIVASTLRTNPRYEYDRASSRQRFVGYEATRNIHVKVRKLDQLTDVMDVALTQKIQGVNNIAYESSKAEEHRTQARLNAIDNSKVKATELARAYDAELGAIVRITYQNRQPVFEFQHKRGRQEGMALMANDSGQGVYLPDEITFTDNIQVVFDLIIND